MTNDNGDLATIDDLLSRQYRTEPEAFWTISQMCGEDGYDRIERAGSHGWRAVPAWGSRGWGLGGWPLVVVFHREADGGFEVAENVEGDATVYRYPTRAMRDRATDGLAFFHWQHGCSEWIDGVESADDMPGHLRGPFSWRRVETAEASAS